jgi:hypothetical protein
MADIIRTWPANDYTKSAARLFRPQRGIFYFTLGVGKPKQELERLWFTYRGRIIGYFRVLQVITSDEMEGLDIRHISDHGKEWKPKKARWVAVCSSFVRAPRRRHMGGFRGYRYFSFDEYAETREAYFRR